MSKVYQAGSKVERCIEGMWFDAVVERADHKDGSVTVKYVDDGNVEEDIPFDEVRRADFKLPSNNNHSEEKEDKDGNVPKQSSTVPRPLAGFIEDDYDERNSLVPEVVIHRTSETENAIIINGAQSKLAVGGGLKALRYLKR
jgi:hypothetical protein